jgi:hypothetical protein
MQVECGLEIKSRLNSDTVMWSCAEGRENEASEGGTTG